MGACCSEHLPMRVPCIGPRVCSHGLEKKKKRLDPGRTPPNLVISTQLYCSQTDLASFPASKLKNIGLSVRLVVTKGWIGCRANTSGAPTDDFTTLRSTIRGRSQSNRDTGGGHVFAQHSASKTRPPRQDDLTINLRPNNHVVFTVESTSQKT